jgi:hypothetical protein
MSFLVEFPQSEFNPDAFARFARHPTTAPSRCPSFVAGLQFWLLSKATAKKYTAGAALGSEVQQDRYHPRSLTLHGCSITFDRRILERPCELRSHFFPGPRQIGGYAAREPLSR